MDPEKISCGKITAAMLTVLVEVGLLTYGTMIINSTADFQLALGHKYQEPYLNWNATNLHYNYYFHYFYDYDMISIGYMPTTSMAILSLSLFMLALNLCLSRNPKNVTNFISGNNSHFVMKAMKFVLVKTTWPFIHVAESVRYALAANKTDHQDNLNQFCGVLKNLKVYAICNDAFQLLFLVWMSRYYLPYFVDESLSIFFLEAWRGLVHLLSFGISDATLLQKVAGRVLLANISISMSISHQEFNKPGMHFLEKILRLIPLFICVSMQICSRLVVILCLVLYNSSLGFWVNIIFFLMHVGLVLVILILFETSGRKLNSKRDTVMKYLSLIFRALASILVLPSPLEEVIQKKILITKSLYQGMILLEGVILTSFLTSDEIQYSLEKNEIMIPLPFIITIAWLSSNALQVATKFNLICRTLLVQFQYSISGEHEYLSFKLLRAF